MDRWVILAQAEPFDIRTLRWPESASAPANEWIVLGLSVFAALLVIAGAVLLVMQRRRARRTRREHQEARIREMLEELNLGTQERELIELVAGSANPSDHLALMESRPVFERRVKAFRERNPNHPALRRLAVLRQRLGFGFANPRVPFSDTRMLPVGQRLQCRIPHPKRELSFVTAVVAASEARFWVRPPAVKGKPASLEKFPQLTFRVTRENDAEYEFTCTVLGQSPEAMRPVALEHTDQIRRLFFRNAPRIPVDFPVQFYVVRQEAAEKAHALLRARDSQYVIQGRLKDLSVGGALALVAVNDTSPREGDTLIFHLAPAQIRDDLVAEVMRTAPAEAGQLHVHLQFAGLKELDRLKLNKYLTNLSGRPAGFSGGPGDAAPAR